MAEDVSCTSSSDSGSDSEDLCEVEIEDDRFKETILVPRRKVSPAIAIDDELAAVDEDVIGGLGFTKFFLSVVLAATKEPIVIRSPRGQVVLGMLDYIQHLESDSLTIIAMLLTTKLTMCLHAGRRYILPSVALGAVWSAFHKLRSSQEVLHEWSSFASSSIPSSHCKEQQLALQVLLDAMMRKILANKVEAAKQVISNGARPLTILESNGIRYMAGYVAVKLLKKFKRCSKNPAVKLRNKLFAKTLEGMKALQQPGEPDSIYDYSTLWMELIDRGGLYHINDDVFELFQGIEMHIRQQFNVPAIQMYVPGTDLRKKVCEDILLSHNTITVWETIAHNIPQKYEKYSVELLRNIADLWITIRGNSFAKGWTSKFERKYKKGTRKELLPAREEK